MSLLFAALLLLPVTGILSLLTRRNAAVGATGIVVASLLGLPAALGCLANNSSAMLSLPWSVPFGSFTLLLDPLAAFFLLPIFLMGPLAAVYGAAYGKSGRGDWFFLTGLLSGMALTILAANAVLFLTAWEVMSVSAFFLVARDHLRPEVRRASRTFLIATHVGVAFLLLFFLLPGRTAGSLDFVDLARGAASVPPELLVLLAFIGFGLKAGVMPMHLWLPDAHPAAPSHVSALMSGVMLKMGVYGFLRFIPWARPAPDWLAWLLLGAGLFSAVWGILFALAQSDLKRLLAYSSVENIGIITAGIGVGYLGLQNDLPLLAAAGFAGALLHVFSHALMKGLLFLAAGSVLHATGGTNMDRMGGLARRMPWSASLFLVGALSICALPPFTGFFGEFILYLAGFSSLTEARTAATIPLAAVIGCLSLAGGVAAAAFTKAFGVIFLGEPRSDAAKKAHESAPGMLGPMIAAACACLAAGVFAPRILDFLAPVVGSLTGDGATETREILNPFHSAMSGVVVTGLTLAVILFGLVILRRFLLSGRSIEETGTWDCGYAAPSARMQYTASSYAQSMIFSSLFRPWLRSWRRFSAPHGFLPASSSMATGTPDIVLDGIIEPFFSRAARFLAPLRRLQTGQVQLYILYIALTLVVLLVWRAG